MVVACMPAELVAQSQAGSNRARVDRARVLRRRRYMTRSARIPQRDTYAVGVAAAQPRVLVSR